jgi:hypothetical protein
MEVVALFIALGALVLFAISRPRRWKGRRDTYAKREPYSSKKVEFRVVPEPARLPDSADQLRWVMSAEFEAVRVMSLEEYKVFKEVEGEVASLQRGYRVFSQTALGEVIRSKDRQAHSAINSKRVDVLVISANGLPLLAVEYQGGAHYQGDAAARDAVKKEALRRAGVAYVEIMTGDRSEDIRRKVRDILAPLTVASPGQTSSAPTVT